MKERRRVSCLSTRKLFTCQIIKAWKTTAVKFPKFTFWRTSSQKPISWSKIINLLSVLLFEKRQWCTTRCFSDLDVEVEGGWWRVAVTETLQSHIVSLDNGLLGQNFEGYLLRWVWESSVMKRTEEKKYATLSSTNDPPSFSVRLLV